MQDNLNKPEEKIDITEMTERFGRYLRRYWILVVVLAVLAAGLSLFRAKRAFVPLYESQAVFTVSSGYASEDIFSASYYDNAAAQQLALAFPHMLDTDVMRDLMKQQLGEPYINARIIPESAVDTNLFTLRTISPSAQDAYDILWACIECYPQVAVYMVDDPGMVIREEPELPTEPFNSFSWKGPVARGGVKGGLLGLILLIVMTVLNQRVTSVSQLKSMMNLPVLAVFPQVRQKKRRSGQNQLPLAATDRAMGESMRKLAARIRRSSAENGRKNILVTSTLSGEGKTTIAVNLAMMLSKEGKKVVLVDADLRKQSVASRLGQSQGENSLLDCIENDRLPVDQCLRQVPGTDLVFLSGKSISGRRYNIDAKGFRRVLDTLDERFDYVILDCAPCVEVADTALLCHFADGVLYVVRPEVPRKNQLLDVVTGLYDQGSTLMGFVVNGVSRKSGHYGYGYGYSGYRYGSRYGYSSREGQ